MIKKLKIIITYFLIDMCQIPYLMICRFVIKKRPCEDFALIESKYNCGYVNNRMTERGLELLFAKEAVNTWKKQSDGRPVIEVGAVTPYYFPGMVEDILDPYDSHERVNLKMDLLDYDFTGLNVLSVSTIEHVGTGDYYLEKKQDAPFALNKIWKECEHCLITCPIAYNKKLDRYLIEHAQKGKMNVEFYSRGKFDNRWKKEEDLSKVKKCRHSYIRWADMIAVIRK